jgi:ATP-dependent Clp protease ATP-binding subunit ClpA
LLRKDVSYLAEREFIDYSKEKEPEIEKESSMSNKHFHSELLGEFTEEAHQVMNLSQEEARQLQHLAVGIEHLLLGLLRRGDDVAGNVLTNAGLELNHVRQVVASGLSRGESIVSGEIALNPRASKILSRAVNEAKALGEEKADTGHLLLGLVREDASVSTSATTRGHMSFLDVLEVNREAIRIQTLHLLSKEVKDLPEGKS